MTNTFFSYPRKHAEVVRDFYAFTAIFSGHHFLDERSIPLGSDFPDAIAHAIDSCDVFLLLWCACANESKWVNAELQRAIEKKKKIIPVLLGEHPLPKNIERINGIKLSSTICEQKGFGAQFGSHLFVDAYAGCSASDKQSIARELELRMLQLTA